MSKHPLDKLQTSIIINLHIYPYRVLVCFNCDSKKVLKDLRGMGLKNPDDGYKYGGGYGKYAVWHSGINIGLIRIKDHPYNSVAMGAFSHEISHVVGAILENLGMKLVPGVSCEAYSYLNSYIMQESLLQIEKQIFK